MHEVPPPRFRVEPLDRRRHDRAEFCCGVEVLDRYLKQQAAQDVEKRTAAVFVLTPDGSTIAGFYSLSQYAINSVALPEETVRRLKLPRYPELPATLLGRLARSIHFRGQKLGEILLLHALQTAFRHSRDIASVGVVVDAKDHRASLFYQSFGFAELREHPNRLFLPMRTIAQLF